MNSKLNQIYQSIEDIRKALGDEAECVPIDELAGMISKLTDDPTRSGFTTTFMFSNDENPNIPQETRLNVNTGLVEDSSGWSQTDFGSATYAMRSQSNDTNWITFAIFGPDGSQKTEWSTPKNLKGEKGERGADGKPGSTGPKGDAVEYIYTVDDYYAGFAPDSENIDGYCPKGWTTNPVGISDDDPTEWVSQRTKDGDKWDSFSKPVIWAKWGYNGKDGNGIEYIYCLTKTEDRPTPPESDPNKDESLITWPINGIWYDDPKSTSEEFPYCWVSVRKQYYNGEKQVWDGYSLPTVWARWSKDGENGGRTVIIYTRDNDINAIVNKPTNGSWDPSTNEVSDIESDRNWSTDPNDGVGKHLWQSNAVFDDFGEKISDWTSPFRMTGEDGTPGKDGETIQFIYRLISNTENFNELVRYHKESGKELSNLEVPSKIDLLNPEIDEIPIRYWNKIESGPNAGLYTIIDTEWTDDPSGISLDYQIECVCSRTKDADGEWTKWSYPTIWSKWGEDGTDGPGVEYIYLITPPSDYDDLLYIPTYKEYQEYDKEYETNYASYFQKDDFIPGKNFAILGENWSDEPSDVSPSKPIEWVSVRKKKDGIWGDFSKPVIWNKWVTNGASFITSYCFTRTSIPLNKYIKAGNITGGNYDSLIPNDTIISVDDKEITIKWYDSVPSGEESVWMISRTFESGDLNPDDEGSVDPSWSAPSLMQDRSDFVVEFTVGHSENPDQKPEPRNLQWAYNEYTLNGKDYISEWRSNEAANGIYWNDNISDANWMATCHLKNGVWTDWSVVKIKGEKGDKGIDGVCTIIQGQAVIVGCIFNTGEQQLLPNNKPAKYLIQICNDEHKLLIWETDHYGDKDVKIGDSYIVDKDLYVWDGDSFENVGQIQGPEGIAGTPGTNAYFYMAFSNEDSVLDRTVNTPIDLALKTGKYVGYLSSTIALSEDAQLQSTTYNWSPWNGQDGWGYEQIFLLTKKENGIDWDNGPAVPTDSAAEKDYCPAIDSVYTDIAKGKDGRWSDTPLTPSEDYPFCWIVTRTTNGTEFGEWKGIDGKATLHNRYIVDGAMGGQGTPAYHIELTEDNVTVPLDGDNIDPDFKSFDVVATLYAGDEIIDEDVKYEYSLDGERYIKNDDNRFEIKSEDLINKPDKLYIRVNNIYEKHVAIKYAERAYEMAVSKTVVRKDWKDGRLIDNQITVTVKYWYENKWLPVRNSEVRCVWTDVLESCDEIISDLNEGTAVFDLSNIENPATLRFECKDVFEEVGVIANGEDGSRIEYIYYRTNEFKTPDNPTPEDTTTDEYQTPDYYKNGWTDELTGVDKDNRYEYVSVRERISGVWGPFTDPKLHSYYGKDGEQGPVGPQGPQGESGKDAFVFDLTNDNDTILADSEGNIIGDLPQTTAKLYFGNVLVETGIDYTVNVTGGILSGDADRTNKGVETFAFESITKDKAVMTIKAVYAGIKHEKNFTITRVVGTADYNLHLSNYVISRNDDTTKVIIVTAEKVENGETTACTFGESILVKASNVDGETKDLTEYLVDNQYNIPYSVIIDYPILSLYVDGVNWHTQQVAIIRDGAKGENGENTIIMALSNPSGTFQYSGDSWVASSDEITSNILVLDGKTDVTSKCELSYSATEGLDVVLENNTITVTPGTIAVAPGKHEVLITAIYEGVSLSKVLTIICATSGGESAFSISLSDDIFQLKAVNGIVQDTTVPNTSFEGYYGVAECDIEFIKISTSVNDVRCNVENNKISLYGLESWYNNSTSDTLNIGLTFKLSFGNLSTERTIKWVVKKVSEKMSLFVTPNVIKDTDSFKEIEIYIDYNNQRYSPTQIGSTTVKVNGSTIQESNYPVSGTTKIDLIVDNKVIDSETVPYLFDGENGNTPYIQSGYWYIAGVSTGIKAEGSNGITPEIGDNGNWWIGNKDTGTPVTGVGVESVDVEYAISDSKTEEPTAGWKSQVTGSVTGKFVWSRTKIVYSNSTDPKYSKAACISGEDGNSIETVTEWYYLSTSATELRGGEWSTDYDSSKDDGKYVWTQTRITFTGKDPIETTPVRASGLPGSNGDHAVTYHISTSKLFVVRDSEGNVIPNDENITYNIVKTIGHDIDHTPDLNGDGIELWQDLNGTLSKINSSYFGYKPASEITDYWCLYLCSVNTPETSVKSDYIDMAEVGAVNQEKGDKGDQGPQGPQGPEGPQGATGSSGPVIYPEGNWTKDEIYIGTSKKAPYVMYNDECYIAFGTVSAEPIGDNVVDIDDIDWSNPTNKWIKMEEFAAIYTDIVFADFAKLGSWVFSGDYMFSQTGTIDGVKSNDYEKFYEGNWNGDEPDTNDCFIPNIVMNAKTGDAWMAGRNISLSSDGISAKNMTLENGCQIGSFSVNDTGLTFISSEAGDDIYFTIDGKGLYFNRSSSQFEINEDGLNYSDSDGNVAIGYGGCGIINAVTTEYKGLLYCQEAVALRVATGENRYAIENLGGMIAGLRPATRTVFADTWLNQYDYNILVHGEYVDLTLPDPILGQTYEIMVVKKGCYIKGNNNINWPAGPSKTSWGQSSFDLSEGLHKIICAEDNNGDLRWWLYKLA